MPRSGAVTAIDEVDLSRGLVARGTGARDGDVLRRTLGSGSRHIGYSACSDFFISGYVREGRMRLYKLLDMRSMLLEARYRGQIHVRSHYWGPSK